MIHNGAVRGETEGNGMRLSRKWARRGRVMLYIGIAGWIGMELLHLIDLHGRSPQPSPDWIWCWGPCSLL